MTHVPDRVVAKDAGGKFLPHPAGTFALRCVDVVDLGERVESYQGKNPRLARKCALVFRSETTNPETGDPFEIASEFTVSMNERASLRLFLEKWRGRPYKESQAREGVPVDKLVGQVGFASIVHKQSANQRTYAKIDAIMPLPERMPPPPEFPDYQRAEFWTEKKEAYVAEVRKFRVAQAPPVPSGEWDDGLEPPPDEGFDDGDLPF